MDLTSSEAEHCYAWCKEKLKPQPVKDTSLTWFVEAHQLYTKYAGAAFQANQRTLGMNELWVVLRLAFPKVKSQKLQGKPIFSGLRWRDE